MRAEHDAARGPRGLDRRFDHDADELPRIVRRHQRLAEADRRVAHTFALGLQLREPLFELGGHPVERRAELRELVVSSDLDAFAEAPIGDRVGGSDEPAERSDDRSSEQVRDDSEDQERCEQSGEEPFLGRAPGRVDRTLSLHHREDEPLRLCERRRLQPSILGAAEPDAGRVAGLERKHAATADAGDDSSEPSDDEAERR